MSIMFGYSSEKTNSFRPVPWHWISDPFPAYRGAGARHRGFLAVGREYAPVFENVSPSADGYSCPRVAFDTVRTKLIRTKEKGTLLLTPCSPEQDEQIMLVTLRGGFRGGYSRIEVVGGEILLQQDSNMHCCPTVHLVVRLADPNGYVFAETGRRSSTGLVEIFSLGGHDGFLFRKIIRMVFRKSIIDFNNPLDFSVCICSTLSLQMGALKCEGFLITIFHFKLFRWGVSVVKIFVPHYRY